MKTIAIVTGANGGFGKELTSLLVKEKQINEIWAIARNEKKLESLKEELGDKIRPISLDMSNRASFDALEAMLRSEPLRIAYLVNNAGFAKFGDYADVGVEESLNMIDLNVSAVVALCIKCIPFMEKGSRIMNVSSLSSYFPLPYLNTYASTKVFVRSYTRALNVELRSKGITATAVCPGWMTTNLYERAHTGSDNEVRCFFGMKHPADVAKKALRDTKKGKDMSSYGAYVKLIHLLSKCLPQRLMMKFWKMQQRIK
jgi:short-subunit dehydrogenase